MLRKLNINSKITLLVLSVVLIVVLIEVCISFWKKKDLIEQAYRRELTIVCDVQRHNIKNHFKIIEKELLNLESSGILHTYLEDSLSRKKLYPTLAQEIFQPFNDIFTFEDLYLLDVNGHAVYEHLKADSTISFPIGSSLRERKTGFYYNHAVEEHGRLFTYASIPVFNNEQQLIGILGGKINIKTLIHEVVDPQLGFGATGEILIGHRNQSKITYLYSSVKRTFDDEQWVKVVSLKNPMLHATNGDEGFGEYIDYNEHRTLAIWKPIEDLGLGIIIKIDSSEAYDTVNGLYFILVVKGIITIGLALALSFIFSKLMTRPIIRLKKVFEKIKQGELPEPVAIVNQDEIGQITEALNEHVATLKNTASFARSIGKRDFNSTFNPKSEEDTLGKALLEMKERLQQVDQRDTNENWVVTGVAELAGVLRSHHEIESLGDAVCQYLAQRLGARQACLYLTHENQNEQVFLSSAFAYGKKKFIEKTYYIGEGIVGETIFEKDTIYKVEVPENYEFIPSGLKDENRPLSLICVPLFINEQLLGILELNADKHLESKEKKYVEQVSEIIAQTIFSIKVNNKTKNLLDEIQHAQTRLHALLENASEIITIANKEGVISYVSPSVESILGYNASELVNTKDDKRLDPRSVDTFHQFFSRLVNSKGKSKPIEIQYKKKNGEKIWLEAMGMNMLNDPAIKGLVVNYRDITTRKLAEAEQRKRGQMQALSENSLDLITRISAEGIFFYLNPMIKKLTGNDPEFFINKKIDEAELDENIAQGFHEIIDQVLRERANVSREITIKTFEGEERIMLVNAIPEYDSEHKIESVLVVSHDITERKLIEMEIQLKNKKIHESINYAERIQSTILPDTKVITEHIPDSFMIFKPRDVVSGDFPWYFQKGDNIYLAVVDCTGHGVPGAMISFVGYFLLNNAAKNTELSSPGLLMDILDQAVSEAFRQDSEDSKIKDGMDMGLCRINIKTKEVEYAGAHRPLYLVREGEELEEIKGDRWPVGGGSAYKNKTQFQSTIIQPKSGDTIYFFSDGLPDQFGGPENRKFGPKRIKSIVSEHHHLSMREIEGKFEQEFVEWKGDVKQTDDILLFGIRF